MEPGQEAPKLKELYAYLGYSIFLSQSLEGLLNQAIFAFVIFRAKHSEIQQIIANQSLSEWESFVESNDEQFCRKALGTLIKKLRENSSLPAETEQALKEALAERNFLAHGFFKEMLGTLYTESGQDEAILFVRRAGGKLQRAIDLLMPIVHAEMTRHGHDKQYIEEYARKAIRAAQEGL